MRKINFISLIVVTYLIASCSSNPLDINIKHEDPNIRYTNVDQILLGQSIDKTKERLDSLEKELGDLLIYELSENIRKIYNDSSYLDVFAFYKQEYILDLEEEKSKLQPSVEKQTKEINHAFSYFAHYFGDSLLPKNIFFINNLFSRILCSDSSIAIGLENYIPATATVIESIPKNEFHQWQRDRMDVNYLKRDILLSWIQVHLFQEIDGNFAEHLIQAGKILYLLNATFPKEEEAYILRYTPDSYHWAKENEELVWDYIVRENLLFSKDMQTRINFLNEGPTTIGLPEKSPDRIGQFIGFRIVKNFMKQNKTLSLSQLLETEYNKILQTYEIR